jgi:hypothetical protein
MKQSAAHAPLAHTPVAQLVPSGWLDQAEVEAAGSQSWQASSGRSVPADTSWPPMSQSAEHTPFAQISPVPHAVPFGEFAVGQAGETPLHVAAALHAPATWHTVPAGWKVSGGQSKEPPGHTLATSHAPTAGRHT